MADDTNDARGERDAHGEHDAASDLAERYRTLFEQAPIGVFLYDRSLRLTACNQRFIDILRSSRDRLIGLDLNALRHQAVVGPIRKALDGETTIYEGPYVATTSPVIITISMRLAPVRDAGGQVVFGMGLVEDISDRVRAEQERESALGALRRSEARFRQLAEAAPDAIAVVRDGRILYANGAMGELLGCEDTRDLIGTPCLDHIHPDDRAEIDALACAALGDALAAQHERSEGLRRPPRETRMLRRNGSTASVEIALLPTEVDGAPALIAFGRDVTERKLIQARLLQADRMVSVGTLAAGVAHEINNPLAYVLANLDLAAHRKLPELAREIAQARCGSPDPALDRIEDVVRQLAEMVDVARDGAARVRHIVHDLKTFARGGDERTELIDVRGILDASVNMAWNEIRHRAKLVREYRDVPPVSANEARLGQVFLNLLVNAAQALPIGRADDNTVSVRTKTASDGWVVVEVADTGAGIPAEVLGRIFDPFFTTKPVGVGTGLGLWICQSIIAALGGEITVESAVGAGTTFRVRLPAGGAPPGPPPPNAGRRGRVLVIDEDAERGRALRSLLADEHNVAVTMSGREALLLLREDARFDVILCDVMMPDMTGEQLLDALSLERPELAPRVAFVQSGACPERVQGFLARIPNARIDRPIDAAQLRALIRARVG